MVKDHIVYSKPFSVYGTLYIVCHKSYEQIKLVMFEIVQSKKG